MLRLPCEPGHATGVRSLDCSRKPTDALIAWGHLVAPNFWLGDLRGPLVELKVCATQEMEGGTWVLIGVEGQGERKKLETKQRMKVYIRRGVDLVTLAFLQRQDGSSLSCQFGKELSTL